MSSLYLEKMHYFSVGLSAGLCGASFERPVQKNSFSLQRVKRNQCWNCCATGLAGPAPKVSGLLSLECCLMLITKLQMPPHLLVHQSLSCFGETSQQLPSARTSHSLQG